MPGVTRLQVRHIFGRQVGKISTGTCDLQRYFPYCDFRFWLLADSFRRIGFVFLIQRAPVTEHRERHGGGQKEGQVLRSPNAASYTISSDVFSFEPHALMLTRGDTDFRLVVDRALASLYRTARIRRIYHDWFGRYGEPLTPIVEAMYEFQAVGD